MTQPVPGHPLYPLQSMMHGQQLAQWQAQVERQKAQARLAGLGPLQARPSSASDLDERIRSMQDLYWKAFSGS